LRIWRDFLARYEHGVELDREALDLLTATMDVAISEIEALEQPRRLDRLNAKVARELGVIGQAEAVAAGVRAGKVSLLPRYRAGRAPYGESGDGGAA